MDTVGYDTFSDSQEFAAARWLGLQHWQKVLGCIKFEKLTDNANGATALSNVKIFAQQHVNGVLLLQVVASAQAGIVSYLNTQNIPVFATDIAAPNTPFLSASDTVAGQQAAQALIAGYKAKSLTASPYVVLVDVPNAGPAVARRMIAAKATILKAFPNLPASHFVKVDVSEQTESAAFNGMKNAESLIPHGAAVLMTGVNDDLVLGAFNALHQDAANNNWTILTVGIGGLSVGLTATCTYSQWLGTVDYAPYKQTGYIVSEMLDIMNHKPVPPVFYTPTQVVNKQKVQLLYPQDCK